MRDVFRTVAALPSALSAHGELASESLFLPKIPPGLKTQSFRSFGRVEVWRGSVGEAHLVAGPFVCRCPLASPCCHFHTPLIEPDVRNDRIRRSEKVSPVRPPETARPTSKTDQ